MVISHYIQIRANLSVHYGILIAQTTLQGKLSAFNNYGVLMKACETKLALSRYFGISAWDNSQLVTPLKFQRGGRSLVSSKVTSRIFVKPYLLSYGPTVPAVLQTDTERLPDPVAITSLEQPIPPPVGMASFEQLADLFLSYSHGYFWNAIVHPAFDRSGYRTSSTGGYQGGQSCC
jgi:hypothetical protein